MRRIPSLWRIYRAAGCGPWLTVRMMWWSLTVQGAPHTQRRYIKDWEIQ